MTDYAVKVTVRNGRILGHMKKEGFDTLTSLAKAAGVSYTYLVDTVGLKRKPLDKHGDWTDTALKIAIALKVSPEDLWSDAQQDMKLEQNSTEVFMDEAQVAGILSGHDMSRAIAMKNDVLTAIGHLRPREQQVIKGRFLEGKSSEEVGVEMRISRVRVGQIEAKAIRKMKHQNFAPLNGYRNGGIGE
jgi:RNA polymerase sigma factor (sigma-70 family)